MKRLKVAIIGQGNVAWHLEKMLTMADVESVKINSRTFSGFEADCDLYLISVSDDVIPEIAVKLSGVNGAIAHTSGSVPINVLKKYSDKSGVFYPLQTFTKGVILDYSKIPFFIEASTEDVRQLLTFLANSLSDKVFYADSSVRKRLHIASVFACNYANHLWNIADKILKEDDMSISVLMPLIEATIEKLKYLSPSEAQTGPASRGDDKIINSHIDFLSDRPQIREIYKMIANDILNNSKRGSHE